MIILLTVIYVLILISRFMQSETYFHIAKRILRDVNGTCSFYIFYSSFDIFNSRLDTNIVIGLALLMTFIIDDCYC